MAFLVPRAPLSPSASAPRVEPAAKILRAADYVVCRQADGVIAHANEQAAAIVGRAQAAYDAQRERGYRDGTEQARVEQAATMIETVTRTVDYFATVEADMVELVLSAVRKIVDGYSDHEKVLMAVRKVLAVVRNRKQLILRLHPDEVAIVRGQVDELLADYPGVGCLDIVADAQLAPGVCLIESEIGTVQASLDGQLQALREAFERVLGADPGLAQ